MGGCLCGKSDFSEHQKHPKPKKAKENVFGESSFTHPKKKTYHILLPEQKPVDPSKNVSENTSEALRKKSTGFPDPVSEHLNELNHALSDAEIHGIKLCFGNSIHRKRLEMRLIFKHRTIRPRGLNIDFSFF